MNTVAEGFHSLDPVRCQSLFAQFRRNNTWQVPTLTVHRSMGYMDDSHFTSDPRIAYMSGDVRRRWDPANDFRFRRWTHAQFEFHREIFNADKQLVGMMFRAGVPLLAGTDAMNPYGMPGFSLHDELALLVESGLTPLAACKPPRCAPRNSSAAPVSLAPSRPESVPTSSCSPPILSLTFTTRRKSRPYGSAENIWTAPRSTSFSPTPSTATAKQN
jgi:hypothetical protein